MKQALIVLVFFILIGFAAAKDVTVVFNFPSENHPDIVEEVSLPNDANAFNAFMAVASSNSLDLNLAYYGETMGWFVNGIDGLNNNWPDAYWHFWVNGAEAQVGISSFVPLNNNTIELGYESMPLNLNETAFGRAIDWLVSNQKQSGEIGNHAVWGNSFALMALSLVEDKNISKQKAIEYLLSNQYPNAGFGYPGFGADAGHSAVATMALLSNGKSMDNFDKNGVTTIDYIITNQQNDGGFSSWGSSDIDSTSWAMLAFAQSGTDMPVKNNNAPVDFILNTQNIDGGFGYNNGDSSKEDYTAESLLALKAAGKEKNSQVSNAIGFLNSKKNPENCLSNSYTTALAIIAFNAWGEPYSAFQDCLRTQQLTDGGFSRDNANGSNSVDTAMAAIALKGKTLPLSISSVDTNGQIPVNSIIKFSVKIKNTGKIKASNVSIALEGLPPDWIDTESSTTYFSSILPGETKTAVIFARAKTQGNFSVYAEVSAQETMQSAISNSLAFETVSAVLEASISME
ncbi:MAG: prenyltransferase/squalene oxidase repeat-containing protein [Candidatus ainarchaeum sp.]|nr:prenyltransferase/squalene oxidase repeat-containing protein [Candidatus ainarchaeum sp.]